MKHTMLLLDSSMYLSDEDMDNLIGEVYVKDPIGVDWLNCQVDEIFELILNSVKAHVIQRSDLVGIVSRITGDVYLIKSRFSREDKNFHRLGKYSAEDFSDLLKRIEDDSVDEKFIEEIL